MKHGYKHQSVIAMLLLCGLLTACAPAAPSLQASVAPPPESSVSSAPEPSVSSVPQEKAVPEQKADETLGEPTVVTAPETLPENQPVAAGQELALKLMTYNIKSGAGMDGVRDIARTAEVVRQAAPDILVLNEVDNKTLRSLHKNQAQEIGDATGCYSVFGKSCEYSGGDYGNALVTRFPILSSEVRIMPKSPGVKGEPRSALICRLDVRGQEVTVIGTHFGLSYEERKPEANYLAGLIEELDTPVILMGDLNEDSIAPELKALHKVMNDSAILAGQEALRTFDSKQPTARIDFIFLTQQFAVTSAAVIDTQVSDHRPYTVGVTLAAAQ
ncbi:MAG: endonuclease/exonuclease/phosphatase family protein [Angelakisella sp.]